MCISRVIYLHKQYTCSPNFYYVQPLKTAMFSHFLINKCFVRFHLVNVSHETLYIYSRGLRRIRNNNSIELTHFESYIINRYIITYTCHYLRLHRGKVIIYTHRLTFCSIKPCILFHMKHWTIHILATYQYHLFIIYKIFR